jgi:hypothetical protein
MTSPSRRAGAGQDGIGCATKRWHHLPASGANEDGGHHLAAGQRVMDGEFRCVSLSGIKPRIKACFAALQAGLAVHEAAQGGISSPRLTIRKIATAAAVTFAAGIESGTAAAQSSTGAS